MVTEVIRNVAAVKRRSFTIKEKWAVVSEASTTTTQAVAQEYNVGNTWTKSTRARLDSKQIYLFNVCSLIATEPPYCK